MPASSCAASVIVLSGLSIWKPVQLQELTALFGGYDAARYVHFFGMAAIVGFLVVHVLLALLVPKSLRAMVTGTLGEAHADAENHSRRRSAAADQGRRQAHARSDAALFLRGGASLGALTLLTGCDIVDSDAAEGMLRKISEFNDGAQAALFNPNKLAPDYPESAITQPFPFNGYYDEDEAPEVDGETYKLEVGGPGRQQEAVDAGRALRAAAGVADHPPCLRRGLERDRLLAGRAAVGIPQAHRRRHARQICLVPSAPRAIPTPSTCRPRCIRRRR